MYEVQVMMKKVESGALRSITDIREACSKFFVESNYNFFPRIDLQFY